VVGLNNMPEKRLESSGRLLKCFRQKAGRQCY
jgi:hypothetical protein